MKLKKLLSLNNLGFGHIEAILAIAVVAMVGVVGVYISKHNDSHAATNPSIVYTDGNGDISTINGDGTGGSTLYSPPNGKTIYNVIWGQSSSTIFFAQGTSIKSNLYSMTSTGSNVKQLTSTPIQYANTNFDGFTYSETSQKLAYLTDDGNSAQSPNALYTINPDGSGNKLIYKLPASDGGTLYAADFSPNGKKILFDSIVGNTRKIYDVSPTGSNLTTLVNITTSGESNDIGSNFRNSWSPNGKEFAYGNVTGNDLEVFNLATMTSTPVYTSNDNYSIGNFSWSPDGKSIGLIVTGNGSALLVIPSVLTSGDPGLAVETESGCNVLNDFDWSPDSSQLVYLLADSPCGPTANHQLYTVPAVSGSSTELTEPGAKVFYFDWSIQ